MQFFLNIYKIFVSVLANHTALALSLLTAFTFIAGHLSAYAYFSAWGIPYFKLTDNYTGFIFSLQNPARVITLTLFSLSTVMLLYIMMDLAFDKSLRTLQKVISFMIIAPVSYFSIALSFDSGRFFISGEDDFDLVKKDLYRPFNIKLSDRNEPCAHLIGEIGRYTAIYLKSTGYVELIKTDDIISIVPLMNNIMLDVPYKDYKRQPNSSKVKAWVAYHDKLCVKQEPLTPLDDS